MNPTLLAVATLGPPALYGTAIAVEHYARRIVLRRRGWPEDPEPPSHLDRLDGLRRHPSTTRARRPIGPEDSPSWGKL